MSKRFPIPDFDRDLYKNMTWQPPQKVSEVERDALIARAAAGDESAYGCYAVDASDELYECFQLRGANRHAIMCLLPKGDVRMLGRSWAWQIQRAIVLDSLDPKKAEILQDWKTPRCMNTRLGPDNGVQLPGKPVYLLFGHMYSDHWIANRTMKDNRVQGKGFAVISSSDESNNDFHACNITFSWA